MLICRGTKRASRTRSVAKRITDWMTNKPEEQGSAGYPIAPRCGLLAGGIAIAMNHYHGTSSLVRKCALGVRRGNNERQERNLGCVGLHASMCANNNNEYCVLHVWISKRMVLCWHNPILTMGSIVAGLTTGPE